MAAPWNAEKAPAGTPKTYDEWTDVLGQTYRAGDTVAVAVINGKSPQMVIGEVVRINRLDSKGCEHVDEFWVDDDSKPPRTWTTSTGETRSRPEQKRAHRPSCTVTVQPLIDARGFYRTGNPSPWRVTDPDAKPKPVTYQFWQNIIKVEVTDGP